MEFEALCINKQRFGFIGSIYLAGGIGHTKLKKRAMWMTILIGLGCYQDNAMLSTR